LVSQTMRIDIGDGFELIGVESAEDLALLPPCTRDDADHGTCTWWEEGKVFGALNADQFEPITDVNPHRLGY
ncbi:MAG: hypothetical protein ACKO8J_00295, partial [Candidatus Limnocylindrus sp.]